MGGAASVDHGKSNVSLSGVSTGVKECLLEIPVQASNIASDGREVIFSERNHVDCSKDTVFTSHPIRLRGQKRFTLEVDGAAVIRVGLLTERPGHVFCSQEAIFETDDGFGHGLSIRNMYINHVGCLCYGEPGAEREFLAINDAGPMYLYVMVIYGQPRLSASHGGTQIQWHTFDDPNIGLDESGYEASCGVVSSAEYCNLKERLIPGHTYLLRWNMELSKHAVVDKEPEYGFIRVGIATKEPGNLYGMNLDNPDVVWSTGSAIASYPYSGTVAILVNLSEKTVEHNILKYSMGDTVKDSLKVDTNTFDNLYLVIEISHGSLAVTHGANIDVIRPSGSIVHVKNYEDFPNKAALYFDIARHGWQPCKILYGVDPSSFVVEFREKFQQKDLTMMAKKWTRNINEINPTRYIQVAGAPENYGEFEMQLFFSRPDACGGDTIVSLTKDTMFGNIWLIQFESAKVARRVSARSLYSIDGHQVMVLPYYEEIGCAVNKGEKPIIDREPFIVTTEMVDGDKIRFVQTSEFETNKLKHYVKSNAASSVDWLGHQVLDQDSIDEEEEEALWVEVLTSNYQQLAYWKTNARSAIIKYFTDEVTASCIQLDSKTWNASVSVLENLVKTMNIGYIPNKETKTVKLISSNHSILLNVIKELGKAESVREHTSVKLSGVQAEKFIALDAENKIKQLAKRYRGTRFSVDREKPEINIKGPENEIQNIKTDLQKLMLLATDISIQVSQECAQIAKSMHKELSIEFRRQGFTDRIKVTNSTVLVCTVIESDAEMKRKLGKMMQCVLNIVKEVSIMVEDNEINTIWKTLIENGEKHGFIVKRGKQCLKITASAKNIIQSHKVVQGLLASTTHQSLKIYVSTDVAEYLVNYGCAEEINDTYTFEHKDDKYTGAICIKGNKEEQGKSKQVIYNTAKNVNTFWFIISRPWLASMIDHIPLERVTQKHACLISADIGDSIASSGCSAVSVLTGRNVAIYVKSSSILESDVDALVTIASPDLNATSSAAQIIMASGGQQLLSECINYVQKNGRIPEGSVALTKPGLLPCRGVIHAVMPQRKVGKETYSIELLVKKIVQVAEREQYFSIALPVLELTYDKLPAETSVQGTMNALKGYFATCKNSSIESVFLCDKTRDGHEIMQTKMKESLNQSPWFTFVHGRLIISDGPKEMSARPQRDANHQFSWDTHEGIPRGTIKWNAQTREAVIEEQDDFDLQNEAYISVPMPYVIHLTENTRLHVVKGSIETRKVDVIVNTTTSFPVLTGAIANAIKRAGGDSILTECRQHNVRQLQCGQVIDTGGGKLPCKRLYHVLIESSWTKNTINSVSKTVNACLEEASKVSYGSIAFPTFGTGQSKYPPDKVAEAMVSSVQRFVAGNPVTSLKDIFIVVFYADIDTMQIFEVCVPSLLNEIILERKTSSWTGLNRNRAPGPFDQKASEKQLKDSSEHSQEDDVLLVKVTSKNSVQSSNIRKDIEQLVDDEYDTKEIVITSEQDEEMLSGNEETLLRSLEKQHGIKINIDTRKRTVILSGLKKDVRKAEIKANDMLLRQFREMRIRKKMAQIVLEQVQWLYEDTNGSTHPVSPEANFDIHMGYIRGKDFTYHNKAVDGEVVTEYQVIVGKLEEYPVKDPTKKRRLYQRNKELAGVELPTNWNINSGNRTEDRVVLSINSAEFETVKKKFLKDGCKPIKIKSITRIEDKYMWLQYQSKKCQLERQNPKGTQNERYLWHGTDEQTYDIIIRKGFDRSFAGKNATAYGNGTYFASQSSYSHRFAVPDASGTRRMFLCRVLTGLHCLGHNAMGVLPARLTTKNEVVNYDSASDHQTRPSMFVIFHDTQAYPEYMITYT